MTIAELVFVFPMIVSSSFDGHLVLVGFAEGVSFLAYKMLRAIMLQLDQASAKKL
jgi:hypothetical protein